jgi:enoyl-CoA hydratase/carnithine racemase
MEILSTVRDGVGVITLNRPAALNALSYEMVLELTTLLRNWAGDSSVRVVLVRGAGEKAFCAGGDIRSLYQSFNCAGSLHQDFFRAEYRLDYLIHCYPKPYVALMDGITMGGGMGIAQGARLRLVTDRTRIAMPEVSIGLVPDVGASFFLSRLPGALGMYLALTATQVRAADALYTGLADVYLPPEAAAGIEGTLRELHWSKDRAADIERASRMLGATPSAAPALAALRPAIDRHFSHGDVESILSSLRAETAPECATWAQQTLATIATRSPLTVAVTSRQLQRGATMNLAECFRMELGLVRHCLDAGDFIEGVRALTIDKDNAPHWKHAAIEAVTANEVDAFFTDPWAATTHPLADLERDCSTDAHARI